MRQRALIACRRAHGYIREGRRSRRSVRPATDLERVSLRPRRRVLARLDLLRVNICFVDTGFAPPVDRADQGRVAALARRPVILAVMARAAAIGFVPPQLAYNAHTVPPASDLFTRLLAT